MEKITSYYGARANERRRQFNNIINGVDAVLMNNIPEVDPSVYENWQGLDPMANDECELSFTPDFTEDNGIRYCSVHDMSTTNDDYCDGYDSGSEIYQWFAIGDNDAEFLKRHNQYITYSDMLDTYFWAITHYGTGWDYVDSMVEDFSGMYVGLEDFKDGE